MDDVTKHATASFKDAGDVVFLLGESLEELGGSEYLKVAHGMVAGRPPALDLELEHDVQEAIREAIGAGIIKSAHDCSEGGIAVTLAECCISGRIGADIHLHDGLQPTASLFGETQSRIVATVADTNAEEFVTICSTTRFRMASSVPWAATRSRSASG